MGLERNLPGMRRTKRFALVLSDNKVVYVGVDDAGLKDSGVEAVMVNTKLHVA